MLQYWICAKARSKASKATKATEMDMSPLSAILKGAELVNAGGQISCENFTLWTNSLCVTSSYLVRDIFFPPMSVSE